jgi:hypothetical protein
LNITSAITVSAWINPSSIDNWDRIVVKSHTSDEAPYTMWGLLFDGQKRARMEVAIGGNQHGADGTSIIPTNAWTHVAVTYDGTAQKVYVNGALETTVPVSGSIDTNNMPLSLGRSGFGGSNFTGLMDEVRVYNVALDQTQINTVMNSTGSDPAATGGEVSYYHADNLEVESLFQYLRDQTGTNDCLVNLQNCPNPNPEFLDGVNIFTSKA